jgi:hypothetical protein
MLLTEVVALVAELLLTEVVEEMNVPMQIYWSLITPSVPVLPSPKASKPPFQTQLCGKAGKGPSVLEGTRPNAATAAPKHSVLSPMSWRPAEAQLRPASSRV